MTKLKNITLNSYINYLFVLYAFLVPMSRAGISILTALLLVLWLFSDNFKDKIEFLKSNRVVMYLFAFIAFSILSLLWSDNLSSGIYYIRKYWYYLTIPVIATTIEKRFLAYGVSAFLSGMLISEIISYGIIFGFWTFMHGTPDFPTPFMSHIQYSMFLAFTSLLLLNRFFYESRVKYKIFYLLYFLTVTANLFLNAGRTGQVAFLISIFIVAFLNIKNRLLAFTTILIFVVSIFYMAYNISSVFKARIDVGINDITSIIEQGEYCNSIGLRIGVWRVGSEIFLDNPILGTGATDKMNKLAEYITKNHPDMECVKHMPSYHNYYVQTAVRQGIIGLFLYLMIFYTLLRLNTKNREYFNMVIIFVSIYSISSMFETMFHEQFSEAILALFVGIFIAEKRTEDEA